MCIILFAYKVHPQYPLVLLANRDEFYDRGTERAAVWPDFPEVYGGRDLVGGGTWLGIAQRFGRIAAVTNYREPGASKGTISRGNLVADFLKTRESAANYLARVDARRADYSGFNLLVGEFNGNRHDLYYYSNRGRDARILEPGIYGLSNHLLDTPWPKIRKGTSRFSELVRFSELNTESLFDLLADESLADDSELPNTGVGYEIEKALSAVFIRTPNYGTRCSTVVTVSNNLEMDLDERIFV